MQQPPVAQGREDHNRDEYQQLITKYTDIIVRLEAQIRALVGDPQPVEPQLATQEQESVTGDPVLEYVQALEASDPWQLNRVIKIYEHNEAVMAAIRALHNIFDPAISFTEQLRTYRATGHIGA